MCCHPQTRHHPLRPAHFRPRACPRKRRRRYSPSSRRNFPRNRCRLPTSPEPAWLTRCGAHGFGRSSKATSANSPGSLRTGAPGLQSEPPTSTCAGTYSGSGQEGRESVSKLSQATSMAFVRVTPPSIDHRVAGAFREGRRCPTRSSPAHRMPEPWGGGCRSVEKKGPRPPGGGAVGARKGAGDTMRGGYKYRRA